MKRLMILCFMLLLLGGGVGALWFFKVPPFGKPAEKKSAETHAAKQVETDTPKSASSETAADEPAAEPPAHADPRDESPTPTAAAEEASPNQKPAPNRKTPTADRQMSEADLTRLAGIYEQMEVGEARRILDKLPDTVVEPLLRRMDEKRVGKLLSAFSPDRAAKLTLAMTVSPSP